MLFLHQKKKVFCNFLFGNFSIRHFHFLLAIANLIFSFSFISFVELLQNQELSFLYLNCRIWSLSDLLEKFTSIILHPIPITLYIILVQNLLTDQWIFYLYNCKVFSTKWTSIFAGKFTANKATKKHNLVWYFKNCKCCYFSWKVLEDSQTT